ncbi:MAG: RagB/SusD family nutrient uptake outer membrane protein, partial [Duncaniella sp.]|nr:RagB/SusD family nutrient uptake outer membrane protein [Duncaniella sp.]
DIDPKGTNLLKSAEELEMLLNREYSSIYSDQMSYLIGDLLPNSNIPSLINSPQKSINSILLTCDEAGHAKELIEQTTNDTHYSTFYEIIGAVANPILSNIDNASGDQQLKQQVKCEALVLRAFFHYLLVQKFAKAYDPAYAAETPAIPYLTQSQNILATIPQQTLEYVYTHIIKDLDEAIGIGALPETPVNHMRVGLPFAYAVKAMALMAMQRYDEAAVAAENALGINSTVLDYNNCLNARGLISRPFMDCQEDFFVFRSIIDVKGIQDVTMARFEDGHICRDKITTYNALTGQPIDYGTVLIGIPATMTAEFSPNWNNFGLKTSQMLLILAECELHKGNITPAMDYLDRLRVNRILSEKYAPLKGSVTTLADAIAHYKQTAHGENIYSYYNFVDRKRWTRLPEFRETYTRTIMDKTYTLTPESDMWIFPFPQSVTNINPSIKQNY